MKRLTQQEEEAMQALWQIENAFIKDLIELMADPKPVYTTLASTMKNLEKKGYIKSEKFGNSYRYSALIVSEEYKKALVKNVIGDYFKNSYKELVSFFAAEKEISAEELKEIINSIENPNR